MVYLRLNYFDNKTIVNVAIYARVSTEHEAQINALQNQIQYYDNILKEHPNWKLYDRYIDKGITGTSMFKRDSFMRMMKDAKEKKFDLIITREVSRFARNTADTLQQVRVLMNDNVGVYFTEDNICTLGTDDDWELKLSLMATLAQNESKKISSRVKAGQKISFENGVFYGNGNILGYDKVGKKMIINKSQAETVKRIYDLYLDGKGLRTIKFILEQEGRKTSTCKSTWNVEVISRVLKNEFYCGKIVYRKEYVPDYLVQKKVKNNGDVEKIMVKGSHEPIITEEQFNQVQEILNSKIRKKDNKRVGHVISKDVYCRKLICECGHTFNKRASYVTKNKETRYLYQCYEQLRHGTVKTRANKGLDTDDCCTALTIPNWKLDIVADWIFRKFFDNKQVIFERTMELIEESLNTSVDTEETDKAISECEKSISTLSERYSSLIDLYMDGDISKEIYLDKKEQVEKSLENKKKELEDLERVREIELSNNNIEGRKKAISEFLMIKPFRYEKAIPQKIIDYYVDSILVDSEKMTWFLKIPKGTNYENVLNVVDSKKKKVSTVTPQKDYELCATLDRQLSTQHVNKQADSKTEQTIVNIGTYNISTNYFRSVKKYYYTMDRVPRNEDFEVTIKLIV